MFLWQQNLKLRIFFDLKSYTIFEKFVEKLGND